MRDDLDRIKIDENGFLDVLKLEQLSIFGTMPIIGILENATMSIEESGDLKEVWDKGYHLVEAALERAKDFEACIRRLVNEQLAKNRQERA
jgi:hypothetical protein